jgi:hypothetical protein
MPGKIKNRVKRHNYCLVQEWLDEHGHNSRLCEAIVCRDLVREKNVGLGFLKIPPNGTCEESAQQKQSVYCNCPWRN